MATPRRRSSRLRGQTPQHETATYASPLKLTAVDEGDELGQEASMPTARTPNSNTRPSPQDMHPARYQSSVKKQPTEQRFGMVSAADFPAIPTTIIAGAMLPPSSPVAKLTATRQSFAAPDFEFKFRQSTDMSSEAQRMMDEVREQAAKIKGDLAIHREVQERKDDEIDAHYGRKIATPKGKSSRYSGVHKDEFQKMSSIANHSSTFRASVAQPAAVVAVSPVKTTKVPLRPEAPAAVPLAKLPGSSLKRTASSKSLNGKEDDMMSPAKRRRTGVAGLIGSFERVAQHDSATTLPGSRPGTPSAATATSSIVPSIATITKPALGRFETVKNANNTTSAVGTFARSPAIPKPFSTPAATRIAAPLTSGKKARTSFVQRLASMKPIRSILRQPQINYSDDPHKLAAGTHISTPKSTTKTVTDNNISSLLPDLQATPPPRPSNRKEKHVAFPNVKDEQRATQLTPSPAKPSTNIVYPTLNLEHSIPSAVHPSPTRLLAPDMNSARSRASVAGTADFTVRSAQRLDFSPERSERSKSNLLNVNTARTSTPTIRHVRASDVTPYPLNPTASASAKKLADLPTVPHGLSNKKRKRTRSSLEKDKLVFGSAGDDTVQPTSSNGGSDKENTESAEAAAVQEGSPTKRMKMSIPRPASAGGPVAGAAGISVGGAAARARLLAASGRGGGASKIPKRNGGAGGTKGRSVLSLSRLQALSKPKERV